MFTTRVLVGGASQDKGIANVVHINQSLLCKFAKSASFITSERLGCIKNWDRWGIIQSQITALKPSHNIFPTKVSPGQDDYKLPSFLNVKPFSDPRGVRRGSKSRNLIWCIMKAKMECGTWAFLTILLAVAILLLSNIIRTT